MEILLNIIGLVLVIAICYLISYDRKAIPWKNILTMLLAEFVIAFVIVRSLIGRKVITILSNGITTVINCGNTGLEFVFGDLFTGGPTGMYVFIV